MQNCKLTFSIKGLTTKTVLTSNKLRATNLIDKLYNKYGNRYETITLHFIY